jgi:GTP-binding protein HflX
MNHTVTPHDRPRERAALVSVTRRSARTPDPETLLDELAGLARAAGAEVALTTVQARPSADPATLMGRGKAELLKRACDEADIPLVIVENDLSPAQTRNLETILDRRVIDRTALILDIFARRARTREGQLQVELAQLEYRLPRLAGSGAALSRLGGGIGTRGPGETKLETDRRRIRNSKQIAGASGSGLPASSGRSPTSAAVANTCARGAAGRMYRPSRSSVTRTRARRPCSMR